MGRRVIGAPKKSHNSFWSKYLENNQETGQVLLLTTNYKVGSGRKMSLWSDKWVGKQTLKEHHPDLFILTPDATIHEVWDNRDGT